MLARNQSPQPSKPSRAANILLQVMLVLVLVGLISFLVLKLVNNSAVSVRLISTTCSVVLFFIKFMTHIRFGPKGRPDIKLKTFGADLIFASITFDVTMALAPITVQNVLSTLVVNPMSVYILLGLSTILAWAFYFYPNTVADPDPSAWEVLLSALMGVLLYFGRLFLYF